MTAYELIRQETAEQDPDALNFIGGRPRIPRDVALPGCRLCSNELTFYFQVLFPREHPWSDQILAMFACTRCDIRGYMTPPMPKNRQVLPPGFLDEAQVNFRTIVFSVQQAGELRDDYVPRIRYERLTLKATKRVNTRKTRIGGVPFWHIRDDTPESYQESHFTFLLQIEPDWPFAKLPEALPQAEFPWLANSPGYRTDGLYMIYSGLPLYFFGTLDLDEPKVYLINHKVSR